MEQFVTSKKACEVLGVHPNTLRKMAAKSTIPFYRTPSGQRRYDVQAFLGTKRERVKVGYARVANWQQKPDLERQRDALKLACPECDVKTDVGAAFSDRCKGLKEILDRALEGEAIELVVVEKKRIARYGGEIISFVLERHGGRVMSIDELEVSK